MPCSIEVNKKFTKPFLKFYFSCTRAKEELRQTANASKTQKTLVLYSFSASWVFIYLFFELSISRIEINNAILANLGLFGN